MAIESLDQFVDHCPACIHLVHRCCKYKEQAWCEKWNKEITDMLHTCFHFERNPDLPPVDRYYKPNKVKKKKKIEEIGEESFFFDYGL